MRIGANSYGKSECRLVRIDRRARAHRIQDLTVSTSLAGSLDKVHLDGDNTGVLPTDSQKNTVYGFARRGIDSIEAFGLELARHFVDTQHSIHRATVAIEQTMWHPVDDISFRRGGELTRIATVRVDGPQAEVTGGLTGLTLLKSTDSEFQGFARDRFTTLPPAADRVLATSVDARWRFGRIEGVDWDKVFDLAHQALVQAFAGTYSRSLQQTLYAMGEAALDACPELTEIHLSLPNKHHFLVDLTPFGMDNPDVVYYAADRPYGLIEGTVSR
ncbi:factor-independent urate hydroxylase [Micromonospora echinofusca]|nr:urate oxidase [Micromonospora echinofusca]